MNILLWILQVLLAVHTFVGAVWKVSNSEQSAPSLRALPHGVWMVLSALEILCALALLAPALKKSLGRLAPVAAICIVAEMALFCAVHLSSGDPNYGPMIYWLVVAAVSAFVAFGRLKLRPL